MLKVAIYVPPESALEHGLNNAGWKIEKLEVTTLSEPIRKRLLQLHEHSMRNRMPGATPRADSIQAFGSLPKDHPVVLHGADLIIVCCAGSPDRRWVSEPLEVHGAVTLGDIIDNIAEWVHKDAARKQLLERKEALMKELAEIEKELA